MNLLRFASEPAWIDGVASWWRDRLQINPRLRMCLPSGHTPNKIYAAMGRVVAAGQASFRETEIFALDDFGGLPPNDDGRCANMVRRFLIDHIDLPPGKFHTFDTDAPDLDRVCRDYSAKIGTGFDLTLLGLGLNGHLGLNEPGSAPDSTVRRVDMHPTTISTSAKYLTHGKLPTWGVAVGLKELLGSKEVWLLVNGAAKAEIVRRVVHGEISTQVPASLLRNHPNCSLILDAEAAALL